MSDLHLKLEKIGKEEVGVIFRERMVYDFPKDELKPLAMMHKAMDEGYYECFALKENDKTVGYTYLIRNEKDYLIDYIATYPEVRNAGFGGELIRLLGEYLSEAESIIGEIENPDFAENAEECQLQKRRQGFYLRNGFRETGVLATCFGVHFRIIEMGEGLVHTEDEIKRLYRLHYKRILPEEMYRRNILV